jgi:AcrR family transcriptional regulator
MPKKLQLSPKKQPSTPRGEQTYRAIVTATARLLERAGYEALTTNHVARRAGVGVASVYEFFPSKHALVAAVVEQMVESVIADLAHGLEHAFARGEDPIAEWVSGMFSAIEKRKRLYSVVVQEVPFFWQVPGVVAARERLRQLALRARSLQDPASVSPHAEAMTYLMPIMVANAVIDSVIRPPHEIEAQALERALVDAVRRLVDFRP